MYRSASQFYIYRYLASRRRRRVHVNRDIIENIQSRLVGIELCYRQENYANSFRRSPRGGNRFERGNRCRELKFRYRSLAQSPRLKFCVWIVLLPDESALLSISASGSNSSSVVTECFKRAKGSVDDGQEAFPY